MLSGTAEMGKGKVWNTNTVSSWGREIEHRVLGGTYAYFSWVCIRLWRIKSLFLEKARPHVSQLKGRALLAIVFEVFCRLSVRLEVFSLGGAGGVRGVCAWMIREGGVGTV